MVLELTGTDDGTGVLRRSRFLPLKTRPMTDLELDLTGLDEAAAEAVLKGALDGIPPDSVARIRVVGSADVGALRLLNARNLRSIAPGMNLTLRMPPVGGYVSRNIDDGA
jgi:hypothetical protein